MGIQTTNVATIAEARAFGTKFFKAQVSTKVLNQKITEFNDTGVIDLIIATAVSTTTDFGSLKVGDLVLQVRPTAATMHYMTVATAGTLPEAAVVTDLYIVLRPSA